MKTIANYYFAFCLLAGALFTGCEKDMPAPPSRVDGLTGYPGKNRVKLEWTVPSDVMSSRIFFNNGGALDVPVEPGSTQSAIVEGLSEGSQTLRVVTLNADGLNSDPKGIIVKTYGDAYQGGLATRRFLLEKSEIGTTSAQLTFDEATEGETGVWIVYTNTSGAKDSVLMSSSEKSISISNINTNLPYYHYSVYKPESNAIDEFYSSRMNTFEALMFDFEKENWIATASSYPDWDVNMFPGNAIDNNINTQWHSNPWNPPSILPQWLAVDMQREKKISGFYFVQSRTESPGGLAKSFSFEVSTDGTVWTVVKEGELITELTRQGFALDQQVTARYFRITILGAQDAGTYWTQIAEVDLYNETNVSGLNAAIQLTNIPLTNSQPPFGFDAVTSFMGELTGWTHSSNVEVSYNFADWAMRIALAGGPAFGLNYVTNGKVYQTLNLEAGDYIFQVDCSHMDAYNNPGDPITVDAYGVAAKGNTLPDFNNVATGSETLGLQTLFPSAYNGHNVIDMPFTVSSAGQVTVGWVYNADQDNGNGYCSFLLNGLKLTKVTELTN